MRIGNRRFFEHRPDFVKNSFLKHVFPKPKKHDQGARPEAPLLHQQATLPNARSQVERMIDRAPADTTRNDMPALPRPQTTGRDVLWPPHLRARIAQHLPGHEARLLMHTASSGSFGRDLGATPRYDMLREFPEAQRAELLRSPATAQAILKEAEESESDVRGALIAASIVRHLPTRPLQTLALDHLATRLHTLDERFFLADDFGMIQSNIARTVATRSAFYPVRLRALAMLEEHLPAVGGPHLADVLTLLATAPPIGTPGRSDEALELVEQHIGRMPLYRLPSVLSRIAASLECTPTAGAALSARHRQQLSLLQDQLPRIPVPSDQAVPLLQLANARWLPSETDAAFHDLLAPALATLSPDDQGRIMAALAHGFVQRAGGLPDVQERTMRVLETHLRQLAPEHLGQALQHLPEIQGWRGGDMISLAIQKRALALTGDCLDYAPPAQRMQTLVRLATLLESRLEQLPELSQPAFAMIASRLPADLTSMGELRIQGIAIVKCISAALDVLAPPDQQPAMALIEHHLPAMPIAERTKVLAALARSGLADEATRGRSLQLLRSHLPTVLDTPGAGKLCKRLLSSACLHQLPPALQIQAVAYLARQLPAMGADDRADALFTLQKALAGEIDAGAQATALDATAMHLDGLPYARRANLIESLSSGLADMDGDCGARCLRIVLPALETLRHDVDGRLANSLSHLAASLSSLTLPLALKQEAAQAISDNLLHLPDAEAAFYGRFIAAALVRSLLNDRFPSELSNQGLALLEDCISRSEPDAMTRIALREAFVTSPSGGMLWSATRDILRQQRVQRI